MYPTTAHPAYPIFPILKKRTDTTSSYSTIMQFKTWIYDGGTDVHGAFALSGEPMSWPVAATYGTRKAEFTASEIAAVNVGKREYQREYLEYWNSTASLTGTGRPVEAIIAPLAPFPAARPDMYDYYGETPRHAGD